MDELLDGETYELFIPGMKEFSVYKYCIRTEDGRFLYKADPYAFHAETPSKNGIQNIRSGGLSLGGQRIYEKNAVQRIFIPPQ